MAVFPLRGNKFKLNMEELNNRHVRYVAAIKFSGDIIGHVHRKILKSICYFIMWAFEAAL